MLFYFLYLQYTIEKYPFGILMKKNIQKTELHYRNPVLHTFLWHIKDRITNLHIPAAGGCIDPAGHIEIKIISYSTGSIQSI